MWEWTLASEDTLAASSPLPSLLAIDALSTVQPSPRENSREGFHALVERIQTFVPLTQVQVLLEVTGHYHRALMHYLQDLGVPVYIIHVQKRPEGLLKSDKRDALNLANTLYNQLEKGIQVSEPLQAVRQLLPPTQAATQLRGMVQHHAELVQESTQRKNKLTAICDELFPELTRRLAQSQSANGMSSAFTVSDSC
jgi:transposase